MTYAPHWRFWLARVFGRRIEGRDGDYLIVAYKLGNHVYVMESPVKCNGSEK